MLYKFTTCLLHVIGTVAKALDHDISIMTLSRSSSRRSHYRNRESRQQSSRHSSQYLSSPSLGLKASSWLYWEQTQWTELQCWLQLVRKCKQNNCKCCQKTFSQHLRYFFQKFLLGCFSLITEMGQMWEHHVGTIGNHQITASDDFIKRLTVHLNHCLPLV